MIQFFHKNLILTLDNVILIYNKNIQKLRKKKYICFTSKNLELSEFEWKFILDMFFTYLANIILELLWYFLKFLEQDTLNKISGTIYFGLRLSNGLQCKTSGPSDLQLSAVKSHKEVSLRMGVFALLHIFDLILFFLAHV